MKLYIKHCFSCRLLSNSYGHYFHLVLTLKSYIDNSDYIVFNDIVHNDF